MKFGNEEQIEKFAKPFLDGDRVGCFGLSEPGKIKNCQQNKSSTVWHKSVMPSHDWFLNNWHYK